MPDIDMDFEDTRRAEVIRYVTEQYGPEHVAQISTFGTLAAKAAIKDAGRALDLPLGLVNRAAAAVPGGANMTLEKALAESGQLKALYEQDTKVRHLVDTATRFEGVSRHASVHAAGVVISRSKLVEHTPLQRATDGGFVTQYPAGPLAKIGLLKMDFLGLINLTILGKTIEYIARSRGVTLSVADIPLDDRAAFDLLGRGETVGVFQLESSGMRRHIRNLKPTSIKEVAAMVALYRPGPIKSIDGFIRAKHGLAEATYLHPSLEPPLRETYGIIVYQDQVLTLVREIAGFSMGRADMFRRAISKKLKEELSILRDEFMAGTAARGITGELATQIYELIEPFAGYGFNKAHAVCYALLAYQTAYLKANYPVEYMAALLACYVEKPDKMAVGLAETRRMGIAVLGPDANASGTDFTPEADAIRFGLAAIKNVGHGVAQAIVDSREAGGPYRSLPDFCGRLQCAATITRATVETLVQCGAFDSIHPNRRALLATVEPSMRAAAAMERGKNRDTSLFSADDVDCGTSVDPADVPDFGIEQRLQGERDLLGVYLSGHPLDRIMRLVADTSVNSAAELSDVGEDEAVTLVGLIVDVRRRVTQKGDAMAYVTLEDTTGRAAVTIFPRTLAAVDSYIVEQQAIRVQGRLSVRDTGATPEDRERSAEIVAESIAPLDLGASNGSGGPGVHIRLDDGQSHLLRLLRATIEGSPGEMPVYLHVCEGARMRRVQAGLAVDMRPDTRAALERLLGRRSIWVE
jgi:DNA polymerase-3 subunit alpha